MDVARFWPVAERRDFVVKRIDPRIEIARRHEGLKRRADGLFMAAFQHGFGIAAGLQHIAFGVKAVEDHPGRVVRQEVVALGEGLDPLCDLPRGILGAAARVDGNAAIDVTP